LFLGVHHDLNITVIVMVGIWIEKRTKKRFILKNICRFGGCF